MLCNVRPSIHRQQNLAPYRYAGLGPHVEVATRDLDALFTLTTA